MESEKFDALKAQYPQLLSSRSKMGCGEGGLPIIELFLEEASTIRTGNLSVDAFYEKYGSLRIEHESSGISKEDDILLDKLETLAECRSYRRCETCGADGRLRESGPLPTLAVACDEHSCENSPLPPSEYEATLGGRRYRYSHSQDQLVELTENR